MIMDIYICKRIRFSSSCSPAHVVAFLLVTTDDETAINVLSVLSRMALVAHSARLLDFFSCPDVTIVETKLHHSSNARSGGGGGM
jgi:hypothetical protein